MRRPPFALIIILLITSGFYIAPLTFQNVHATNPGVVCIAKDGSTSCPVAPPLITFAGSIPSTLRVAVAVSGSDGLDGLDIVLLTNHTILTPWKIDFTNSLLMPTSTQFPLVLVECIGGQNKTSGACTPATDTVNTIHLSATAPLGSPNTAAPTTGLLFTAIYNITGTAVVSPISFQTGCTSTSVSGGGGICVSINNGTPSPVPETVQTAKFSDRPYFDIQTSFFLGSLTVAKGDTNTSLTLNVTSVNGFGGVISLDGQVSSPIGLTPLPTLVGVPTSVTVNSTKPSSGNFPIPCCQVNVTVSSSVQPGTYNLTFTGTSPTYPANSLSIPLFVPAPNIMVFSTPGSVTFNVTSSGATTVTVKSVANFAGTVNVTLGVPTAVNASFPNGQQKTQLSLAAKGSSTVSLRLNSTIYGSYPVNITATSGQLIQTFRLSVVVQDFIISASSKPLTLAPGATSPETLNLFGSSAPYTVTVDITKTYITQITSSGSQTPSTGISVSCTPNKGLLLTNSSSTELTVQTFCYVTANILGNYTVAVLAVGGKSSHVVSFSVLVLPPDFTITPSIPVLQVSVGGSATMQITAKATSQGCTCNVSFASPEFLGTPTSPPTVTISPSILMLNSTHINGTAIVTITTGLRTPAGTYFVLVTASPGTHVLQFALAVSSTTSPHNLSIYSLTPSTTSTTVGSKITLTYLVQNLGRVAENATITAIAGDQSVDNTNITNLQPDQNVTVTLTWDTSTWAPGAYMIGGKILGYTTFVSTAPVTLAPANVSILESPYFAPSIIVALIVIVAIISFLLLQARRKPKTA